MPDMKANLVGKMRFFFENEISALELSFRKKLRRAIELKKGKLRKITEVQHVHLLRLGEESCKEQKGINQMN